MKHSDEWYKFSPTQSNRSLLSKAGGWCILLGVEAMSEREITVRAFTLVRKRLGEWVINVIKNVYDLPGCS